MSILIVKLAYNCELVIGDFMAEIVIPDFANTEDFNRFVATQKDEDVQAWKTADWNNLYDKLDKIVPPESRLDFARNEGKDALIKLNANYRLEREDMEHLREISKQIAKNIVAGMGDEQHKITSINTDNSQLIALRKYFAQVFDKAVYDTANYKDLKSPISGKKLSDFGIKVDDYDATRSEIEVEDREQGKMGVRSYKDRDSSRIKLTTTTEYDGAFTTAVHESIHAHLQTLTEGQQEVFYDLSTGPIDGMSNGFYRLLQHNSDYYVSDTHNSNGFQQLKEQYLNGDITDAEFRKQANKNFKGYSKQPLETHAEIMALTTEHYYRQETQQYSERAERAFVDLIDVQPTAVTEYNGDAMLIYQNNPEALDRINTFKQYINPEYRNEIKYFRNSEYNSDIFTIPKKHSVTNALRCAEMNIRVAVDLVKISQCYIPKMTFENNECIFHYSREDAQKIQDLLKKHTDDKATAMFKFDAEGALHLPQSEVELKKIVNKLYDAKKDIENTSVNKQDITQTNEVKADSAEQNQQIERVRNKINSQNRTEKTSANSSSQPQFQRDVRAILSQIQKNREIRSS